MLTATSANTEFTEFKIYFKKQQNLLYVKLLDACYFKLELRVFVTNVTSDKTL